MKPSGLLPVLLLVGLVPLAAQNNTFPTPSGNVGIGTTSPATTLEVVGAGESVRLNGSGSGANSLRVHSGGGDVYFGVEGTTAGSFFTGALAGSAVIYSGTPIQNIIGGVPRTIIDTSGNVGIGTVSPAYRLHVVDAAGQVSIGLGEAISSTNSLTGFRVAAWDDSNVYVDAKVQTGGSIRFRYGEGAQSGSTNTWMTVKAGNVGIGTTSPSVPFEVRRDTATGVLGGRIAINNFAGASYASVALDLNATNVGSNDSQTRIQAVDNADWSANLLFLTKVPGSNGNALAERMRITSGGNVGIGTDAAAIPTVARLHLHSEFNNSSTGLMIDASDTTDPERYNLRLFPYVVGPAMVGYKFQTKSATGGTNIPLAFDNAGNVGIGTTSPAHKLAVNGTIKAKEVIVETTGWSDYVFAADYRLAPLAEVEAHIREKKHLPGIPSTAEVEQGGVSLGDMQARLLAKVEELTLHAIAQEKRMQRLESENQQLRSLVSSLHP